MERNAFARAQPSPAGDAERAIGSIIRAWAEAWNAHDMELARALVAAEIEFVTVAGLWLKGGEEFLAHHRAIHRMQMRESGWTNLQHELQFIREDLCLVHLEWTIAADRNPDGTPRERRYGLFTWLTERRDDRWLIIAVHNSDLRPGLRHRLSGVGGTTPGAPPMTGIITRRALMLGSLALLGCVRTERSSAADELYPARPVRLLVGGAAGSVPDTVARLISERLAAALGQPVVVDDRPGASGILAMQALVGSAPDGYTIALATVSQAVFNSYLFSRLSYDPLRDLEPISPLVAGPMVIVAHPAFPANTFEAFVSRAKAEPGKILFGTTQLGSPPDVFARFLMRFAGADVVFVPFKSGLDGMSGVLRGDVQLFVDSPLILREQIKAGGLKALAVTGHARERELPDVPTLTQSGFSADLGEPWIGLVAPAHTPRDVVDRLNREVTATLQMADLRDRLERLSFVPVTGSPTQFRMLIRDEHARWGTVIRDVGLKLD